MSPRYPIIAGWLLAASQAQPAELACKTDLGVDLPEPAAATALPDESSLEILAGEIDAVLGEAPDFSITGGALLKRGDRLIGADTATYDAAERAVRLAGNVRYEDPQSEVVSESAEFAYESGRIVFTGAEFSLGASNGRGGADNVLINRDGELQLDRVHYTTCPPGSDDWVLLADDIDLDTREGIGTARDIKLRFQGVPILWAPFISFPIGDARKTGILTPEIGSSGRSGNEIRVPWYWNIAPNYDATITPRLLTERGLQLQTEFRYLTGINDGELVAQYLPNDEQTGDARHLLSARHRSLFANDWRALLDYRDVSDNQYFEDLGGSLSASSTTHLDRHLSFDWHSEHMDAFAQVQDFQVLDDSISPEQEPYQRLPQLMFRGWWPEDVDWLEAVVETELVNFERDTGVTGWRANVSPRLDLPIDGQGWYVTPSLEWDYTAYQLDDTEAGQEDSPTRSLPLGSLDTGLIFERRTGGADDRIQTLEPRLLYVHVPYRDQDGLPVFDTIVPDLNLVQLFRRNRFLGLDRIGDTEQVSIGVTTRIFDSDDGRELVSATVGQARYLGDRLVTLPGGMPATEESSDYIAEVRFLLYEHLNFDFGHQWGTSGNGTAQSEARLQYRPQGNKILNLAYRYRRDSLEQGDLSWSWPLAERWNFVGRYNYSFRDEEVLEQFFGLEYESCCWGLRVVSRRHVSTRDGTYDSSFGLQLVLKGMASVGTAADRLLERGILGYSADLR
ncbi:MAG TPA: LPS assembly protein LptD [Woeseiaceae bacterium]|nr:LPS assembly protein LptD [Woeseiaceae bacterium]